MKYRHNCKRRGQTLILSDASGDFIPYCNNPKQEGAILSQGEYRRCQKYGCEHLDRYRLEDITQAPARRAREVMTENSKLREVNNLLSKLLVTTLRYIQKK